MGALDLDLDLAEATPANPTAAKPTQATSDARKIALFTEILLPLITGQILSFQLKAGLTGADNRLTARANRI
jgi:hypothetical protein